jgi:hypothetical protein
VAASGGWRDKDTSSFDSGKYLLARTTASLADTACYAAKRTQSGNAVLLRADVPAASSTSRNAMGFQALNGT